MSKFFNKRSGFSEIFGLLQKDWLHSVLLSTQTPIIKNNL